MMCVNQIWYYHRDTLCQGPNCQLSPNMDLWCPHVIKMLVLEAVKKRRLLCLFSNLCMHHRKQDKYRCTTQASCALRTHLLPQDAPDLFGFCGFILTPHQTSCNDISLPDGLRNAVLATCMYNTTGSLKADLVTY